MSGLRGYSGPPLPPGLPSRPSGNSRDRADEYRGGGRGGDSRGPPLRDADSSRYERGDYPPRHDYDSEWVRQRDDRERRGGGGESSYQPRRQRERTRSPPSRGDRWSGGRPVRDRSPLPSDRYERAPHPHTRRSPHLSGPRRSPSPTRSSRYTREGAFSQSKDSGYSSRVDREWERDRTQDSGRSYYDRNREVDYSRGAVASRGTSPSPDFGRSDSRRDHARRGSTTSTPSYKDRHSPPPATAAADKRASPPLLQPSAEDHSGPPSGPSRRDSFSGPTSTTSNANHVTISPVNSSGIPTGPKASFTPRGRGRGDSMGAAVGLGRRGGPPVRGAAHLRGVGTHGYTARGRGVPMGWGSRGRGGGIVGAMGASASGLDDLPARSLARKVDAVGNAVMPDLMSVPSGTEKEPKPSTSRLDAEDPEEGEREEGEMDEIVANEPSAPAAFVQSQSLEEDRYESGHEDSQAHVQRPPFSSKHSHSKQSTPAELASGSGIPSAASAVASNTPGHTTSNSQNPYTTGAWSRPPAAATPTASTPAAARPSEPKIPPSYTPAHFSKSVNPEWDAELWTLSAHRLSAIPQHPLSTNYHIPLQNDPTTPSAIVGSLSIVSGLRSALADLKEAMTELEMCSVRSQECERSRAGTLYGLSD